MDPLLPLTPLPTHIKQLVRQLPDLERRLRDTRCLHPRAQDVLVCGEVPRARHALDGAEVVDGAVVELELARTAHGLFDARVPPQRADGVGDVPREDIGLNLWGEREDDGAAGVVLRGEGDIELWQRFKDGAKGIILIVLGFAANRKSVMR